MLQHTLQEYKVSLNYEHNSKIDTLKSNKKVCIRILDELQTSDTTKVKDNGFLVVPLVIAGGYKGDFTVTLGKNNVDPSFPEFVLGSFQTEVYRSGNFNLKERTFLSDYILKITLLDCQISTQYHKDRIRYGRHSRENWLLKPVTGNFIVKVQLSKKRNLVFEKVYSSTKSSQLETQNFKSEHEMNKKMMEDFAQTASIEIKDIIETIIQDLNEQIQ